jgi:2',3'-cyclic-nucleotide 2'-phosphodiesterase (5'-nucleotidase family)
LARRATIFKQTLKETDFHILVDAGGFTRGVGDRSKLLDDYLLKGLSMLGYSAINLAVPDFANGGEFLSQMAAQHNLDLLSANVFYQGSGKLFAKPYVIKEIVADSKDKSLPFNKMKIAIIGLCDTRNMLFSSEISEPMLESRDPVPILAPLIKDLRKKSDLIILLWHGRFDVIKKVIQPLEGIDIAVLGQEYYRIPTVQESIPILLGVPSQGKYSGILTVELDSKKKIIAKTIEQVTLSTDVSDDPQFAELVKEYQKAEQAQTEALSAPPRSDH